MLISKLRKWTSSFYEKKQTITTTERCCFSLTGKEIRFVKTNHSPDSLKLLALDTWPYSNLDHVGKILNKAVKKYNLDQLPTYWLLSPEEYQLFVIESLPVKGDELKEALKWRVKSLINYPVEESVMDYFTFPSKKSTQENAMIAAVIAKSNHLLQMIRIIKECNLQLIRIDIPELAMRNLTSLFETDEKSSAFIYIYPTKIILNITRNKTLYFSRIINMTLHETSNSNEMEQLSLDILRYFDYFQSQWRFPSPSRVFIGCEHIDPTHIAKLLAEYLSLNVEPMHLNVTLDKQKLELIEKKYLLPFGDSLALGVT